MPAGVLVRFAAAGVREVIVKLIVAVTASTGLQVRAELDRGVCWVAGPDLTGEAEAVHGSGGLGPVGDA